MVRVKDLKNQTGVIGLRPILYCSVCGAEYSANAGDYWDCDPTYEFVCCNESMQLVVKQVSFNDVCKENKAINL